MDPEALVADFWDQDGLVASLEVSGSKMKKNKVLKIVDVYFLNISNKIIEIQQLFLQIYIS